MTTIKLTADTITDEQIRELQREPSIESELDEKANDGRLGTLAKHLAIDAGADWPSLDGEAQDAWHEHAIRALCAEILNARAETRPGKMPPQVYECGRDDCPGTIGTGHRRDVCPILNARAEGKS